MDDGRGLIRRRFEESLEVTRAMLEPGHVQVMHAIADAITRSLKAGGTVLFCGNGGSAADSAHLAAELVGRFYLERAPLRALSLSENAPLLTAIGNDFGYEETFARQVRANGHRGDVLVGLSTSGESPNVVRALEAARDRGITTVGFTGTPGGKLPALARLCLCVPSSSTARIQEGYMLAGHAIVELVERQLSE
jgi:D-sedoheptulose 7-phosphate isomerase